MTARKKSGTGFKSEKVQKLVDDHEIKQRRGKVTVVLGVIRSSNVSLRTLEGMCGDARIRCGRENINPDTVLFELEIVEERDYYDTYSTIVGTLKGERPETDEEVHI